MDVIKALTQILPSSWLCTVGIAYGGFTEQETKFLFATPSVKRQLQNQWGRKALYLALEQYKKLYGTIRYPTGLSYKPNGKPFLFNNQAELDISISHTANVAVAAVCKYAKVGIDIEALSASDPGFMDFFLDSHERQVLSRTHHQIMPRIAWSIKEAVIKMLGIGLSGNQNAVKISRQLKEFLVHVLIDWKHVVKPADFETENADIDSCYVYFTHNSQYVSSMTVSNPIEELK